MTDLDLMPFGKYKGTPMQDVPSSYLHYLWTKCGFKDIDTRQEFEPKELRSHKHNSWELACYISANLNALRQENDDLIWT